MSHSEEARTDIEITSEALAEAARFYKDSLVPDPLSPDPLSTAERERVRRERSWRQLNTSSIKAIIREVGSQVVSGYHDPDIKHTRWGEPHPTTPVDDIALRLPERGRLLIAQSAIIWAAKDDSPASDVLHPYAVVGSRLASLATAELLLYPLVSSEQLVIKPAKAELPVQIWGVINENSRIVAAPEWGYTGQAGLMVRASSPGSIVAKPERRMGKRYRAAGISGLNQKIINLTSLTELQSLDLKEETMTDYDVLGHLATLGLAFDRLDLIDAFVSEREALRKLHEGTSLQDSPETPRIFQAVTRIINRVFGDIPARSLTP